MIATSALSTTADGKTSLRLATGADLPYIDALRKREGDALGFIPKQNYEAVLGGYARRGIHCYLHERIILCTDNNEETGFAYVRFSGTKSAANIWQIVIQEDARRWHRALLITDWVEAEALRRGCSTVKAKVAADIESNLFWKAAGYEVWGEAHSTFLSRAPSKSGRRLLLYAKHLSLPWQPQLEIA